MTHLLTARAIAIDPGAATGYAWTDDGQVHHEQSGVWQLGKINPPGRRYAYLTAQIEAYEPEFLFFEQAQGLRGKDARRWHSGYLAAVQIYGDREGVPVFTVTPSELKKHATGYGLARKPEMLIHAERAFGFTGPMDDNRVDALWILDHGLKTLKGTPDA